MDEFEIEASKEMLWKSMEWKELMVGENPKKLENHWKREKIIWE